MTDPWAALTQAAIATPPPCSIDPESHWPHSGDAEAIAAAEAACMACSILSECQAYDDVSSEPEGVWAGRFRTAKKLKRMGDR